MTTTDITILIGFATIVVQSIASNAKQKRDTAAKLETAKADTTAKLAAMESASEQWVRDHFARLAKDLSARLDRAEAHHRNCEKALADLRGLISDITPLDPAE